MTVKELINKSKKILIEHDIENAENETYFTAEKVLNLNRTELMLKFNSEVTAEVIDRFSEIIEKRISGIPLQYCLGEWDFYGNTYKVGEGVLIPRPETEELCDIVIKELKGKKEPVVADLCSGSGCIGLTIKDNIPDATVFLVEKSKKALNYLIENAESVCNGQFVSIINGDVLKPDDFNETLSDLDAIISNPPYIKSEEIDFLQNEVQFEPRMALDGGNDGYDFYRVICSEWHRYLRNGGFIAFECGENQADYIAGLFDPDLFETEIFKDFNSVDRFVIGRKKI